MWTHTGEYCLFNAIIIIIIYTGVKVFKIPDNINIQAEMGANHTSTVCVCCGL